jgi:TonB family protein
VLGAPAPFSKLLSPRPLRENTAHSVPGGGAVGGRYEIRGTLGEGPLAAVYRAFDREIEVEVAVKVMRKNLFLRDEDRTLFVAGCDAARRLSHPNLIRIFHADARGAYPFFAMQLVEGLTLRQVMERRREAGAPFSLQEIEPIVSQVATALDYLHQFVPAHGLIKPENLMLVPDLLKLTDYNISTSLSMAALLIAETRGGAHNYIAPEVRQGGALMPVADVYSTAMIMTELLIGALPSDPELRIKATRPDIPTELEFLLKRCLAPDPRTRVQRVADLARGLRAFVQEPAALRGTTRPSPNAVRQSGPPTIPPMSASPFAVVAPEADGSSHRAPPPVPPPGPAFAAPPTPAPSIYSTQPMGSGAGPAPVPTPAWGASSAAPAGPAAPPTTEDDEETQVSSPGPGAAPNAPVPVAADAGSAGAVARRRRPIPIGVWIGVIVAIVGGGAWAVIEFLDKLRADREAVERETERERAQLAQERMRLEALRHDLESKTAEITRAAVAAKERAAAAAQAAGGDPTKRAEAARLDAEAKRMEAEAKRMEAEKAKVRTSLKAVKRKLKKKDEPDEPDTPAAPDPSSTPAPVVAAATPSPTETSPRPVPGPSPIPDVPSAPPPSPTTSAPVAPAPAPAPVEPAPAPTPTPVRTEEEDKPTSAAPSPAATPATAPTPPPPEPTPVPTPPVAEPAPPPKPATEPEPAPVRPEPPPPPRADPPAKPRTVFLREGMPEPERVEGRDPEYVPSAREAGIAGTVIVMFRITTTGRVRDVRVIKQLPVLGEACAAAVRRWRFAPYQLNGEAVNLLVRRGFQFRL